MRDRHLFCRQSRALRLFGHLVAAERRMLSLVALRIGVGAMGRRAVGGRFRDEYLALRLFLSIGLVERRAARILKTSVRVATTSRVVVHLLLYLLVLLYRLGGEYHVDLVQVR